MEPLVEAALREAAQKAYIIDADIIALPEFADARNLVRIKDGQVDSASIKAAIHRMQAVKPTFFRGWDTLTPDEYSDRDRAFREGLRQSRPVNGAAEFKILDASRLDDTELSSLSRVVSGFANAFDRALLTRALARQRQEDAALGGDAA